MSLPHAVEGDVWRAVSPTPWEQDGTFSWVDIRIPRGHFRGTLVLAAPPEWRLPFAPMRSSSYRGDTHVEYQDKYGDEDWHREAPVLICDAWGRPPAAAGRDRFGRALPPHDGQGGQRPCQWYPAHDEQGGIPRGPELPGWGCPLERRPQARHR